MIVIGSNSEVAQAFIEEALRNGEKFPNIYLLSSNPETAQKLANHLNVKYLQVCTVVPLDLTQPLDLSAFSAVNCGLLFCAAGYLGLGSEDALYDEKNTQRIISINYAQLVPLINYFAEKMEHARGGTIIGLSSVAGERGRQSNFIYGSAKAGFTAYLSGLRNYLFERRVHVMTVKPGFMDTKMTEGLPLNPALTASPRQAAEKIYKAWKAQKDVVFVLPIWRLIMLIIRNIPEFIFKKMKL